MFSAIKFIFPCVRSAYCFSVTASTTQAPLFTVDDETGEFRAERFSVTFLRMQNEYDDTLVMPLLHVSVSLVGCRTKAVILLVAIWGRKEALID